MRFTFGSLGARCGRRSRRPCGDHLRSNAAISFWSLTYSLDPETVGGVQALLLRTLHFECTLRPCGVRLATANWPSSSRTSALSPSNTVLALPKLRSRQAISPVSMLTALNGVGPKSPLDPYT